MYKIRAGLQGVRFPDGWPPGLRGLHCDLCDRWHSDFRFENLHLLLRFLRNMTVCFRGYGSRLMFSLGIVHEATALKSCFEHSCAEALEFATHYKKTYEAVKAGGVAGDLMSRPVTCKMIAGSRWVVDKRRRTYVGRSPTTHPSEVSRHHDWLEEKTALSTQRQASSGLENRKGLPGVLPDPEGLG